MKPYKKHTTIHKGRTKHEISLAKLSVDSYKVTRRVPDEGTANTKFFDTKKQAEEYYKGLKDLDIAGYLDDRRKRK